MGQLGFLLGIGGRFGRAQQVVLIDGLNEPHDLTLLAGGELLMTTLGDGGLSIVDIAARQISSVARGLGHPTAATSRLPIP